MSGAGLTEHQIILPRLHRLSGDARIVAWLKEEGDRVRRGESLLVMETGKGTVNLDAEVDGVLNEISQSAGEWIPVESVVGTIRAEASLG